MERNKFEMYWRYYLSIESMMINTAKYVCPSRENAYTYSDEFMKIILLSCSEIDSIMKEICKQNGVLLNDGQYNMKVYSTELLKNKSICEIAFAPGFNFSEDSKSIICFPFRDINKDKPYAGLLWWESYQKLKHNRIENAKVGNLINSIYSLGAHFLLLRKMMELLSDDMGKNYVIENYWSDYFVPCV